MYDTELVLEILSQIKSGAQKIERRFSKIETAIFELANLLGFI